MSIETLQCKDFRIIKGGMVDIGEPKDVLDQVNEWISDSGVRVVNVESIINTGSGSSITHDFNGVRVWYMTTGTAE